MLTENKILGVATTSKKNLHVIITSGGTRVKIDDVRHIGNFSTGTTGAKIAEEFLEHGATVYYLHAIDAKRPFKHDLTLDPTKDTNKEIERLTRIAAQYQKYKSHLHEYPFETYDDYARELEHLVKNTGAHIVLLAAAVSDYTCTYSTGKVSSSVETMQLTLTKTLKIISLIKQWNPKIFLVGFKLLADVPLRELIDTAYKQGIKNHCNLTVANSINKSNFKLRTTFLITPEKGLTPVPLDSLPRKIVEMVSERVSTRSYQSVVKTNSNYLQLFKTEIEKFKADVSYFYKHCLFQPYYDGAKCHFGFVAKRIAAGGFLITSRASNKEDIPLSEIVYIPKVDFEKRLIYTESAGNKASLNANVAAAIFSQRPEIDILLHSHISLGITNKTKTDYAPGTQEDVDEVMRCLSNNERMVEQINHGIIALGSDPLDITTLIGERQAYDQFPEYYDAVYHRFQRSTEFIDLIEKTIPKLYVLLDLAAGTGDVSSNLIARGYQNLTLADQSDGMLTVAKRKIAEKMAQPIPTITTTFATLDLPSRYDAIVTRQAINYTLTTENLTNTLRRVHRSLHPGGFFIFNAPNYFAKKNFPSKINNYDWNNYEITVEEQNHLEGNILTHTQHSTLLEKKGSEIRSLYDLNRFALFTKEEFEHALQKAGFRVIRFYGTNLEDYSTVSRALYCVATA